MSTSRMGIIALFGAIGMIAIVGKSSKKRETHRDTRFSLLFAIVSLALYTGIDAVFFAILIGLNLRGSAMRQAEA